MMYGQTSPGDAAAQSSRLASPRKNGNPPEIRYVENGTGMVGVNPAQPYRPIPVASKAPNETIVGFYLRVLNPRQINWGTEIDRRLAILREESIGNPYFRLCAFLVAATLFLATLCWAWWDKMRQIKWAAAECLTDALNAKTLADQKAMEAIEQYNRHIEMCNRVIEGNESAIGTGHAGAEARHAVQDLQNQLAGARAEAARLDAELQRRKEIQTQLVRRVNQLEADVQRRAESPNNDLVARLQRAEAELSNRKAQKK
jgi:hypothetical protein